MKRFLKRFFYFLCVFFIFYGGILSFYENIIIDSDDSYINIKYNKVYNKGPFDLIIMGDSRAERQLNPKTINRNTGKKSINLAISSGDINRIKKFFIVNDELLIDLKENSNPILLVVASDWQVNDNAQKWGYLSHSTISFLTPFERFAVLNNKGDYFKFVVEGYKIYIKNIIESIKGYNLKTGNNGFLPINEEFKGVEKSYPYNHPYYSKIKIDGWRWRLFASSIRFLNSNFRKVILVIPPTSPFLREMSKNTKAEKMTFSYIKNLKSLLKDERLDNITVWDFYNEHPLELSDSDFYDVEHLNSTGAEKFSNIISKKIALINQ